MIDTGTSKDLDGEGSIQHQHKVSNITTDITSPRKKLRLFKSHDEDRISYLADSVITHILSRLPTRDAVATSVLSRDWRRKWTCISDIYLNTYHLSSQKIGRQKGIQSFYSFMNRLLLSSDPWRIRSFRLISAWMHSEDIEEWATAVLRRGVQNLDIITPYVDNHLLSPQRFSSWKSLTELKLCLKCTLGVSARNCLSRLKSLCLMYVRIENEESQNTRHVLLSFPVLEVLELKYCEWINVDYVEIKAPKLIKFTSQSFRCFFDELILNAPSVTHAYLDHTASDEFCTVGLQNIERISQLEVVKII